MSGCKKINTEILKRMSFQVVNGEMIMKWSNTNLRTTSQVKWGRIFIFDK